MVKTWLSQSLTQSETQQTIQALLRGDAKTLEVGLQTLIRDAMSFWDTALPQPEQVYHAFVLGLLVQLQPQYRVRSNRESGFGRYDVMVIPLDVNAPGIILEFKRCHTNGHLQEKAKDALTQIQTQEYASELHAQGVSRVHAIGIAFHGKSVRAASIALPKK